MCSSSLFLSGDKMNPPDSNQHQNHEKSSQPEPVVEQHDPLGCLTMGDQEMSVVSPEKNLKVKKNIIYFSHDLNKIW